MRRALRFIPQKLRHSLFRKSVRVDFLDSNLVEFKIAETRDELEQAFQLVYQSEWQKSDLNRNSTEMSLAKIHALPNTKVLVAIKEKKVMATLCLSLDGALRTPCEELFDMSQLKLENKSFVELSNVVVAPEYINEFKSYLFPLCKLSFEINKIFFKADYFVTAIENQDFDYWRSVFLLEHLPQGRTKLSDGRKLSKSCGYVAVENLEKKYSQRYAQKKSTHDLHQYLFVQKDFRIQIPTAAEILKQRYSPQILHYFFNIKTNIFAHMTSFEIRTLHKIYDEPEYEKVLPNIGFRTQFENHRNSKRYHAHLTGYISLNQSAPISIVVKTVSLQGVGAICTEKLNTENTYNMKVNIGEKIQIDLLVSPVWSSRDQTYGFIIRNQSTTWSEFIDNFHSEIKQVS